MFSEAGGKTEEFRNEKNWIENVFNVDTLATRNERAGG
jgi:hypothetical protein